MVVNDRLDLVTIGESMLRFTPPAPQVLEQAPYFEVRAGGAESNVAITAARMGLRSGWVCRLPDNPLGRRIVRSVQEHGVDVSRVIWTDEGRVGIYFIDSEGAPRPRDTIYDRAGSAITELGQDEVDWDYLANARVLHLSGITMALGDQPRSIVARAIEQASGGEQLVSFDLNFRAKLWSAEEARAAIEPILGKVDILRAGLDEAQIVLDLSGDAAHVAKSLHSHFSPKVSIITDGAGTAAAYDGQLHTRVPRTVQIVDRIGAGDAFMAGFLVGYIEEGTEFGLKMASELGALKLTYLGDIPWCTRDEVLAFMEDRTGPSR